ncbi:hypothetical protein CB1_000823031 [Camelus ferus]|nr:hypothetical protein CB1_000823031 [Camelus ferus]
MPFGSLPGHTRSCAVRVEQELVAGHHSQCRCQRVCLPHRRDFNSPEFVAGHYSQCRCQFRAEKGDGRGEEKGYRKPWDAAFALFACEVIKEERNPLGPLAEVDLGFRLREQTDAYVCMSVDEY